MEQNKIFPQKLPKGYHGKPRQRMPTIHKKNLESWQNPQIGNIKPSRWQKKSIDQNVIKQRKEMITSSSQRLQQPRKVSAEAPDWVKRTFHYYHKTRFPGKVKESRFQESFYDVLNNKKTISFSDNLRQSYSHVYTPADSERSQSKSNTSELADLKIRSGFSERKYNSLSFTQREISPKVGSLETRDYSIKKPLLKIGKESYVDTYSPFII